MFFFNDTATTEIYTLSLHDALPIFTGIMAVLSDGEKGQLVEILEKVRLNLDKVGVE